MVRPRRGGGKQQPLLEPPNRCGNEGSPQGALPPPPPPPPPPSQEEEQPDAGGQGEPERGFSRMAAAAAPAENEPSLAATWVRGLQQTLKRHLPGGAAPAAAAMKRGGSSRRGAKSDGQKPRKDRAGPAVGEWQGWLHDALKETGVFIAKVDNKIWLTLLIAVIIGILHWYYISTLFENDRHFSHLSALEKEMSFRTEMGLYYSYFKTIIEAPSFFNGVWMIMNDNLTEYPATINTLKRFNLYPEIVLANWYRMYTGIMDAAGIKTQHCWNVNRGEDISPVESCEGLGDPASFYVAIVFLLNGLMVSVFFLYGTYLSGSRSGGLLTVACFFFNHGESTRVMWTPPLRESFSYPFLVIQMLLLTYILRTQNINRRSLIALSVSNVFFMLPWQFAQFVLLTQVASLFGVYILGFIDSSKLQKILYAHMASLGVCFVLMFGNSMLLTSFYAAALIVSWGILEFGPKYLKLHRKNVPLWAIEGFACLFGTITLKSLMCLIFGITDDAHITNLLKAKFTSYRDFDTSMYTCAVEFGFLSIETPINYMKTLLLPVVLVVFSVIIVKAVQYIMGHGRRQGDPFIHGEIVYHALQLMFFTVLAFLIMRLKLFLTPHMCIMASLICSKQLFGWVFHKIQPATFVIAVLAMMSFEGIANIQKEWKVKGEFSNLPQEELLLWITANTKQDAVFAGTMPIMASVKLSTLRPIVNHPHYEDAGLRARTKIVYSMYSRKPAKEVKRNLVKMGVNYYILEDSWCLRRTGPGCSMAEIWDLEDTINAGKVPLCNVMSRNSRPYFRTVFNNNVFKVLEVTA
uniref:Protein C-mannosyl-transferase DPY19L1 n=1 Tax=Pogona vitticeps TaxID=103695 RepID=A0A6J0TCD5_9SAUR